jgi:N-acetyl-alpha-D-muramate 1-phosphate uridylyltransferase
MLTVAILAGGFATRLRPLTETIPKSMIEICGKPFIHWQMKLLAKAGVTEVIFCVAFKAEAIIDFLGDGSNYGMRVRYSHDGPNQLGTGGAIVNALPLLSEKFFVLYGDSYLPIDYSKIAKVFLDSDKPALMTVYANHGRFDASNVDFTGGELRRYQKGFNSPEMTHIDYGLSCFDESVFSRFSPTATLDLAEICNNLALQNHLAGYEVVERFYEIGSHKGILDFTAYVERNFSEL